MRSTRRRRRLRRRHRRRRRSVSPRRPTEGSVESRSSTSVSRSRSRATRAPRRIATGGPARTTTMHRFVSRSIDLLEESSAESGHAFRLNRRGYLFATARDAQSHGSSETARRVSSFGMGEVRRTPASRPTGRRPPKDSPTSRRRRSALGDAVHAAFPYLAADTVAALHVRRAGWLSAVALGSWLLSQAVANGARFVRDRVSRRCERRSCA